MDTTSELRSQWLHSPRPNAAAKLQLVCLPYAGGGSAPFQTWPDRLPDEMANEVEVVLVQLPGRESRLGEPLVKRMDQLIEQAIPALDVRLDKKCALFGHSLGALIGYEMARTLERRKSTAPCHLFLSGLPAPQLLSKRVAPPISALTDAELMTMVRRSGTIPEELLLHQEYMDLWLPVLRADMKLVETYRYMAGKRLSCRLTIFGGLEDITFEALSAWKEQTTAGIRVQQFPGDHYYFQHGDEALLQAISQDLQPYLSTNTEATPARRGV